MSKDIGRCFHWRKHYKKARFLKVMTRDYIHRILPKMPWAFDWVL